MPSPNFADFTGNGLPDLILGDFLDKFTFFENIGTRTNPRYAPGRHLTYNNEIIRMDLQMIQPSAFAWRSEEHTSELQSPGHLVCRLLLEKKNFKFRRTRFLVAR